jgi:hypothetical protein
MLAAVNEGETWWLQLQLLRCRPANTAYLKRWTWASEGRGGREIDGNTCYSPTDGTHKAKYKKHSKNKSREKLHIGIGLAHRNLVEFGVG